MDTNNQRYAFGGVEFAGGVKDIATSQKMVAGGLFYSFGVPASDRGVAEFPDIDLRCGIRLACKREDGICSFGDGNSYAVRDIGAACGYKKTEGSFMGAIRYQLGTPLYIPIFFAGFRERKNIKTQDDYNR